MVDVRARDPHEPSEGPLCVDEGNVQFWCKHSRELEKPHVNKALRFLRFDCVRYVGGDNEYAERNSFICLPLNTASSFVDPDTGREFQKPPYNSDYNSTVYTIVKEGGSFVCNCQGWTYRERQGRGGRDGCSCSHVLALFFAFKIGRFRR